MDLEQQQQLDQTILEGLSICRGVVQRYLAYVQGMTPEALFPDGIQPSNEVGFKDDKGKLWFLKLDIVDDSLYKFPMEKCPGRAVREMIAKIINNLHLATQFVITQDLAGVVVPHPELFVDARIGVTPFTSAFLYNPVHGRRLHDEFTKRIAFVWADVDAVVEV